MDGLRAVAIVLVVAFHVGLAGFSGGFIGVDVFFVISGFLITRGLVAESERQGRPALLRFWARRVRRLVPALGLMLVVVLGLALVVVPFVEWQTVASQARAAALYVSNLAFARQATDYFAPNIDTSLFLHTWSLGVEEQFYLLWPLLVLAVCVVVKDRPAPRRAALAVTFGVTFAASLALCIVQTANGSAYAFFGLPARAWEFAAAGLLAIAPVPDSWRGARLAVVSASLGIAALALATATYSQDSTYPGYRALLPVIGALLVIHGGTARRSTTDPAAVAGSTNPVSATLALPPLQWLGRVSYSWYLWHWPFILLAVQWVGRDSVPVRAGAALVALGVGVVAHAIVENPARFDPRLVRSRRLTYSMGAAITALVLVVSVGLDERGQRRLVPRTIRLADLGGRVGPEVRLRAPDAHARRHRLLRGRRPPEPPQPPAGRRLARPPLGAGLRSGRSPGGRPPHRPLAEHLPGRAGPGGHAAGDAEQGLRHVPHPDGPLGPGAPTHCGGDLGQRHVRESCSSCRRAGGPRRHRPRRGATTTSATSRRCGRWASRWARSSTPPETHPIRSIAWPTIPRAGAPHRCRGPSIPRRRWPTHWRGPAPSSAGYPRST